MEHIGDTIRRQAATGKPETAAGLTAGGGPDEAAAEAACRVCKDARFVHPLLPNGKPDYSRVVPCTCALQQPGDERLSRLQKYSNLGPLSRLTFDNLRPNGRGKETVEQEQFSHAYEAARSFADKPGGWLVLTGPSGSGKTHLATAIANHCVADNRPAFYVSAPDLLDRLRSSFNTNSEIAYDELFDQVRNTPLLVLDDFGAQSGTIWAKEKLEQLLNHRFANRLPTVIVSIVPVEELEERIRTRLSDSDFCRVVTAGSRPSTLSIWDWAPGFALQKDMTFDNFDWKRVNLPLEQRQNLEKAFRLAEDFARSPDGWLVFQGVNGCGKTHLAAAIVNHRYQHGKSTLFIVVPDFLDHLRSSFGPDSKVSYDQLFEGVKNVPLLVFDDLGTQSTTAWAREKLYQVINHRYNARLATVITTNCATEEIDTRLITRLVDPKTSTLFTITAPDYYAGRETRPRGGRRGR